MTEKTQKYSLLGKLNLFFLSTLKPFKIRELKTAPPSPAEGLPSLRSVEKRLPFDRDDDSLGRLRPAPKSRSAEAPSVFEDLSIETRNYPNLEHGPMPKINAIVLHQSASASAQNTLKAYQKQTLGAHFLIGRDGKIYQTAALDQVAWHVGEIRPRDKKVNTCSEAEYKRKGPLVPSPSASHRKERVKDYPARFPSNHDSIGIEIVGRYDEKRKAFEAPTQGQLESLSRLLEALKNRYRLSDGDIYRHGSISYKKVGEGCGFGYD